jgi:hypothetical protein
MRMVFLAGPPGSGKSTLGRRVCRELNLRFADLVDPAEEGDTLATLEALIAKRGADVVALPWAPSRDASWLRLGRKSGTSVVLWAHPLEMQARSGRAEALFTPVPRMHTRGGFGRNGTSCAEFRHLERACEIVLLLVGHAEDDAAQKLKAVLESLTRDDAGRTPAQREGLLEWARSWQRSFDASPKACEILLDAMARFTLHLKEQGASPRKMADVYSDLNAAGWLIMGDSPRGKRVLASVVCGPSEYEYRRKFTDSPTAWKRFRKNWEAWAAFLRDSGCLMAQVD